MTTINLLLGDGAQTSGWLAEIVTSWLVYYKLRLIVLFFLS